MKGTGKMKRNDAWQSF